jgi:hypothetical protein
MLDVVMLSVVATIQWACAKKLFTAVIKNAL